MNRRVHTIWALLTSLMTVFTGCRPQQPFYLNEETDFSHYVDVATQIDYPDVETTTLAEVEQALPPLTLDNVSFEHNWEMTLEEAVKTSLANAKVMRSLAGRFVSSAFNNRAQTGEAPDAITSNPDSTRTVYDPAIVETTPFAGVEYALSAFDTQWSTNSFFQKNDRQQNVRPQVPITDFFRQVFTQDTNTFNTQLTKVTAEGGQFTLRNNIVYDLNNNPTRNVAKDWNLNYEASFNQPLLAGAGTEFNRIAGPFNPFTVIPGGAQQTPAFDGVLLARINVDISLADFEAGVRNLVSDVEQAYWELAFAWRNMETSNAALASAKQTWKKIHQLYMAGTKGGEAKEEAQAREQYFQFKSTTQTLVNELFRAENRLRYVLGIAATDGRLIMPIDKPTIAKIEFDWREITEEAMARSLDLRRQKWRIKQQELQLVAAKNLLLPRLDLNGTYRWQGLGDTLVGNTDVFNPNLPGSLAGTSAMSNLTSGQFQEWALGVQMTMPIGFRKELSTVRFYQLNLARERAKLQDEELEVSHQLTDAVRQLKLNYELTQTNFNRTLAADTQVDAVQAAFDAGTVTLDQLLEAQRRRAEAQTSFWRTLLDYQRAIIGVHFRKGSLLEYNNVYLAEGPWPAKAQFDAHRLARQRDASIYLDYGYTRPSVMSQGSIRQNGYADGNAELEPVNGIPHEATPENIPAPREMLPTPDGGPSASKSSRKQPNLQTASSGSQEFEWGPLGTASETKGDSAWTGLMDGSTASPAESTPTTSAPAIKDVTSAGEKGKDRSKDAIKLRRDWKPKDGSVQQAKHQE